MINMFHPFSMVVINQQEFRRVRVPQSSMFFALRKLKVTEICARIAWWQVKLRLFPCFFHRKPPDSMGSLREAFPGPGGLQTVVVFLVTIHPWTVFLVVEMPLTKS